MAVSAEALPDVVPEEIRAAQQRRRLTGLAIFGLLAVLAIVLAHEVPTWLDLHLQKWAQDRYHWSILNRQSSAVFTKFFNPIADFLDWSVVHVEQLLDGLRWAGILALVGVIGWRTAGLRAGALGAVLMAGVGVFSDWDLAMRTLAIMTVAVIISLVLGVPLGVLTSRSDRMERIVRVVLDTAQVLPIFVYLSPLEITFGLKFPPAVVATVIYALPPAVRLTNLGIRSVPVVTNEVGHSFGATPLQQLFKIQLPMARRAILLGLNQVIMMAFAVVVLASLLGTGDLGQTVLDNLQKNNVGKMFAAGLSIVLMAMALDRITTGERAATRWRFAPRLPSVSGLRATVIGVGVIIVATVASRLFSQPHFPTALKWDVTSNVNSVVHSIQDHLGSVTQWISDVLVKDIIDPLYKLLIWLPWLLVVVAFALVGWLSKGWRLAATVATCLVLIGAMGTIPGGTGTVRLWDLAMNTLSQVLVAIVLSVLIALPLGLLVGRSDRAERAVRPVLDFAQVLPQFVYLIPVVFLFGIGRSAGVVACVVYAVPPCVRLTSLGLREVPFAPREAAISFGATRRQELLRVQLPLARRSIMLGINQTMMMVLATVIIAALIGAQALGLVAYEGTVKSNLKFGQGLAGGLSIVLLAIMLDRLTQAWGTTKANQAAQ